VLNQCYLVFTSAFWYQVTIPEVEAAERLLLAPLEYKGFYRAVARYGYLDRVDQVGQNYHWKNESAHSFHCPLYGWL
jgi:hypothetical protein